MIVVTGAAGFIGSCLIKKLNDEGHKKVVAVDDFQFVAKEENLKGKDIGKKVEREAFFKWLDSHHEEVEFIFHKGARTDTTEFNQELFDVLNINYTKTMWKKCTEYKIPLVYASSAATYGDGDQGYDDNEVTMHTLTPLNPYGMSKHVVDLWILEQKETPPFWAGLKFFNVYGPNEYHKGRMASVVWHAYEQIRQHGFMKLFRSHRDDSGTRRIRQPARRGQPDPAGTSRREGLGQRPNLGKSHSVTRWGGRDAGSLPVLRHR